VWRPLLVHLRPWANITLMDIPGCAAGQQAGEFDAVLDAILACCPPRRAVYIGWSLGGQLATELARQRADRVSALVTVCSNPRFIAAPDWPGMREDTFGAFRAGFETDPAAALRRFHTLQATGSCRPRQRVRQLRHLLRGGAASAEQSAGLDWLATLDQRAVLGELHQPRLHLLAADDSLVPADLGRAVAAVGGACRAGTISVLERAGHLAPLDAPGEIAAELRRFLAATGALPNLPPAPPVLEKTAVAASFSRAAARYDSAAHLQRKVGEQLLADLDDWPGMPARVLDLGCGTGHFRRALQSRYPGAHYIGLDLAPGMVDYARGRHDRRDSHCDDPCYDRDGTWLVGDAEALPLASGSVDLVFSSLAVQWCYRPAHLFAELARVLADGGRCVFTSMGPHTLRELRSAWASVDAYPHVNAFMSPAALRDCARVVPGIELSLERRVFTTDYERVRDLLDELKALGAHNMNRNRPGGLAGRQALQGMLQAYETYRRGGKLPATWEVIFGVLEKKA
jgi:malonyl-CoA O-methyltransferase